MAFVENRGAKLYWDDVGSGEPLLMINGLGTTSAHWHRTRPVLARVYRTLALDNRGAGRSDAPEGIYPISLMASDALAVLDAAGVAKAHVFGVSLGGMIAQELTLRNPERVGSLILGCTTVCEPMGPHAVKPDAELLAALARHSLTPHESNELLSQFLYHPETPRERLDEDMAVRSRWPPNPLGYQGQLQGIMGWSAHERLAQIAVPTLVMHGEADKFIPPGNANIVAQRIPGAKLVMIPKANHVFWTDQPALTHELMLEFLAEQSFCRR